MYDLRAGAASVVITPPVGVDLVGYGGRQKGSHGVHDDLHAKALVLDNGEVQLAMVTLDLIGLDYSAVRQVRADIAARTDIPADHVLITCSHTHSGPLPASAEPQRPRLGGLLGWEADEEWTATLLKKLAGAVDMAWRRKQPAQIGIGQGQVDSISYNRRRGYTTGRPIDPEVGVLLVTDMQEAPLAIVMNFACHAVIMRDNNYLISADYPGAAMALVERCYPGAVALFAQGCCGNIDPLPLLWGEFVNVERVGTILGAEVLKVVNELLAGVRNGYGSPVDELIHEVPMEVASELMTVPLMEQPDVERAQAILEEQQRLLAEVRERGPQPRRRPYFHSLAVDEELSEGTAKAYVKWAETLVEMARAGVSVPEPEAEVQVMTVGPARIAGLSGEIFLELGQRIKRAFAGSPVFVLGYANGTVGYVPTREAFEERGYEVTIAQRARVLPLLPGAGEMMADKAIGLLKGLESQPLQ